MRPSVAASSSALALVLVGAGLACAADVQSRPATFRSAGYALAGTVTGPAENPVAGVLLLPGSGPVDRDGLAKAVPAMPPVYRQWAERLGEAGFVVLRYDKRYLTHPDVDIPAFDQEAQIADALAAMAYLRALPDLTARPLFVVGHSEGGTLAPLVAERSGGVAGVVIVNSIVFPVDELVVAQLQAQPQVPRTTVEDVRRQLGEIRGGSFPDGALLLGAGAGYWSQWIAYSRDAEQTLSRSTVPLLLIHCSNDATLPGDTLARNVAVLRRVAEKKKDAQLRELQDLDHLGMRAGEREVASDLVQIVVDWLRRESAAARGRVSTDDAKPAESGGEGDAQS